MNMKAMRGKRSKGGTTDKREQTGNNGATRKQIYQYHIMMPMPVLVLVPIVEWIDICFLLEICLASRGRVWRP